MEDIWFPLNQILCAYNLHLLQNNPTDSRQVQKHKNKLLCKLQL